MRGIVAFVATDPRVLAFERIAGFFMVKGFYVPLDERKIFAIVLRVATRAFPAGAGGQVVGGMQTLARQ